MRPVQEQRSKVRLAVGCPVYERGWVLNHWFDALDDWARHLDIHFVFVYTPSSDDTLDIIDRRATPYGLTLKYVEEGDHSVQRNWGQKSRLETMAFLRNELLDLARETEPDLFLSLDSDILVPPWEPEMNFFRGFYDYDAIGLLAYLGIGSITNAFYQDRHRRTRAKVYDALQPVDILCAAKVMSWKLLMDRNIQYGYHSHGEDLYWSDKATSNGYRLGFDTRIKCKHIMKPDQLDRVDDRVGF